MIVSHRHRLIFVKTYKTAGASIELFHRRDFYQNHLSHTDPADRAKVLVDRIVLHENLNAELAEVFGAVRIPFDGDLGAEIALNNYAF